MNEWNISQAQFGQSSANPVRAGGGLFNRLGQIATAAVEASALGQQIEAHRQREDQNRRESLEAQHAHEKWMAVGTHQMSEEAKDNAHKRTMEILKTTHKGSEPGTEYSLTSGDVSVRSTKKKKNPTQSTTPTAEPAPTPEPTPAPAPATSSGGGWVEKTEKFKRLNKKVKIVSPNKPTVKRGPGGKMMSLKKP